MVAIINANIILRFPHYDLLNVPSKGCEIGLVHSSASTLKSTVPCGQRLTEVDGGCQSTVCHAFQSLHTLPTYCV